MEIKLLHDEFCDYCLVFKNYRPSTIKWYKERISVFLKRTQITELEEVSEEVVSQFFFQGRKKYAWGSENYMNYKRALTPFFNWCVEKKLITANPVKQIPKLKRKKRKSKYLTVQDSFTLLEVTQNYPYKYKYSRVDKCGNYRHIYLHGNTP